MKIIVAVALLLAVSSAQAGCYSEGIRRGEIQKFSQKGYVNKSWEGEMVQEGVRTQKKSGGNGLTNVWKFSVTDPNVAKKIDEAVFEDKVVIVKYCQAAFNLGITQSTSYTVTDARAVK